MTEPNLYVKYGRIDFDFDLEFVEVITNTVYQQAR